MTAILKSYLNQRLPKFISGSGRFLLDHLLPPRCLLCGAGAQDAGRLCGDCWKELTFLQGACCACCGHPFDFDLPGGAAGALCAACLKEKPPYDHARAALRYDDGSRRMIISFKHGDRTDYADFFGQLLVQAGHFYKEKDAIVIPVPLHKKRLRKRRYNQAALMAQKFAEKTSRDYIPDMLVRVKHTPPQEGNYDHRTRNVTGAFRLRDKYADIITGRKIILIDDVYTTGATAQSCARALRQAGASAVNLVALARVCQT